ncbi:uncharacterized protein [Lepeophtheirus salmonis]|uniref:uncharacterized protein n=1 Tax=Lepeophtheirus salmonis TaxID=72036 RepID=UPI001AE287DB|nr:uncharacterized protein LOC121127860 [Lepeophtheirus salmonis]
MNQRFVIAFSTSSFVDQLKNHEEIYGSFFKYREYEGGSSSWSEAPEDHPTFNLDSELEIKNLSEYIHVSLDDLPTEESFTLDILWQHDLAREEIPIPLFGALKRAVEWHGALIRFYGGFLHTPLAQYLTPATLDDLKPCLWRGNLSFYDSSEGLGDPYEDIKGFSLHVSPQCLKDYNIIRGVKTISRSLIVVSTNINVSTVPKPYFKRPLSLKFECKKDDELIQYFYSTYLRSRQQALLLRLEYSCNSIDFGSKLKTKDWNKGFQADDFDPDNCIQETLGKQPESLYILVLGGTEKHNSWQAWTLSSEGCHPFEGFHVRNNTLDNMQIPISKFPEQLDPGAVMDFLREAEEQIIHDIREVDPNLLQKDNHEAQLDIIRRTILDKIGFASIYEGIFNPLHAQIEEGEREEKRFLKFLSEQQRVKQEAKMRQSFTAGPGYIKWEVKELLKFFTNEGLAKIKDHQTEVLSSKVIRSIPIEDDSKWPHLRNDVMGIDYNRGESSEAKDRKMMEILKTHVGTKETISTCLAKVSSPDIIPVVPNSNKKPTITNEPEKKSATTRVLRSSPRKKKSVSKEEVFKQKLRNAVFNALSSRSIDMKHELFRPCFKKLFEISKMYAGTKLPAGQGSTKEWLNKVTLQNVESVITLEKTLQGSS